jgi:hypothetical protein
MAILRAQNFDLEFSYYNLNTCNEIDYSLDIKLNGVPFFNPDVLVDTRYSVKNGKFIFSDCEDDSDWLHTFFIEILKTKKGNTIGTMEDPEWHFTAITWEDKRVEKEKLWRDKTIKIKNEKGEIVDEPYAKTMEMFTPLFENNIEFNIEFPNDVFQTVEFTTFGLKFNTTFFDLVKFLEKFNEEMKRFYTFFNDRIQYLGNGKYCANEEFENKYTSLDQDVYIIKKCAEWNNDIVAPDCNIIIELLLSDIYCRGFCIVGSVRYIIKSSVTKELAKEIYILTEKRLTSEKEEAMILQLNATKKIIAIAYPAILKKQQTIDALKSLKKEDIPEEIFDVEALFYLQHLKT